MRHSDREAAALCRGCGMPFCRECVTEHGGRLLCAGCLAAETAAARRSRTLRTPAWLRFSAGIVAGVFVLWVLFCLAGEVVRSSR
ncbi:MAG TPA: hypothetical protein VGL42_18290 [Opitutaceae bacterium]